MYDRVYYEKYLGCLIGENMMQWGVAGFRQWLWLVSLYCFRREKKNGLLKAGFLLLNLFLLVPFARHVLNGFSYVSNRWLWAYSMLIAYIFVKIYPELFVLKRAEKKKIFCMLAVYCVLALFFRRPGLSEIPWQCSCFCLCVFACTSFGNIFFREIYLCAAIAGILTASICLGIASQYSYDKGISGGVCEPGRIGFKSWSRERTRLCWPQATGIFTGMTNMERFLMTIPPCI